MSWLQDVLRAVYASWRLLLRDTGGYDDFDLTEAGFWRSFTAIIPIAPVYLYAASIEISSDTLDQVEPVDPSSGLPALTLIVQWIAWPLVMVVIARFAGLAQHYSRYIIAYNWSSILVMAAQLVPIILFAQGDAAIELGRYLFAAVLAVVLYYRWYIAHTALETTGAVASALVLGDLVLSFGITRVIG